MSADEPISRISWATDPNRTMPMKRLICPVSEERIDHAAVRTTAFLLAMPLLAYAATGHVALVALAAADYAIRAFLPPRYSPTARLSMAIARRTRTAGRLIDRAPKVFSARVGFLLAATSVLLYFVSPGASLATAATLTAFALLESIGDICVGCLLYTSVIHPLFAPTNPARGGTRDADRETWYVRRGT